jgi:hypothetical protein
MCIDCFCLALIDGKIVKSSFEYLESADNKVCEVCHVSNVDSWRHSALCLDCATRALIRCGIIDEMPRKKLHVRYIYDDDSESHRHHTFRERLQEGSRYKQCSMCSVGRIAARDYKVCIDCLISACITTHIFDIEDISGYEVGDPPLA